MTNESVESSASRTSRLTYVDAIGILLLSMLFLVLSFFRSRHRMFWGDEIMGWLVLTQPNWHALLHLWKGGIDSSGIWFYVLGRPWITLFGASEVSLREFSAAGVAASAAVIWITARRFYSVLPVAAAVSFVYSATFGLGWQLANGRTYGLLLLACSLVIYLLVRGEDPAAKHPSAGFLLATFGAYSFLAGSHILGFLYVGAFIGMQLAFDLYSRRFRPWLYLCAACSFAVVVFSRANLISTAALGKPTFWTPKPSFPELLFCEIIFGRRVVKYILLLLVLLLLSYLLRKRRNSASILPRSSRRRPVYLLALGFLALDVLIFVYSLFATSLYVDRYLLPFSFVAILLLCEIFTRIREIDTYLPRIRALLPAAFLLLSAAYFFVPRLQRLWLPYPDYTKSLLATIPKGLPVVDTDGGSFVEVQFYHHGSMAQPFLFPTDWKVALDPSNAGGVSGFHEMDNFKTFGLYASQIQPTAQILDHYRDFVVLTSRTPTTWFQRRILSDPRFSATSDATFDSRDVLFHVWVVHRK